MKILQIVESAYRATLEEQDDTVVWLSHALKNAGADVSILLRSNAVNYAVASKNGAPGLPSLGVEHPPHFADDLKKVQAKGAFVYVYKKDLEERGISNESLIPEAIAIEADGLSKLLEQNDYILHW